MPRRTPSAGAMTGRLPALPARHGANRPPPARKSGSRQQRRPQARRYCRLRPQLAENRQSGRRPSATNRRRSFRRRRASQAGGPGATVANADDAADLPPQPGTVGRRFPDSARSSRRPLAGAAERAWTGRGASGSTLSQRVSPSTALPCPAESSRRVFRPKPPANFPRDGRPSSDFPLAQFRCLAPKPLKQTVAACRNSGCKWAPEAPLGCRGARLRERPGRHAVPAISAQRRIPARRSLGARSKGLLRPGEPSSSRIWPAMCRCAGSATRMVRAATNAAFPSSAHLPQLPWSGVRPDGARPAAPPTGAGIDRPPAPAGSRGQRRSTARQACGWLESRIFDCRRRVRGISCSRR